MADFLVELLGALFEEGLGSKRVPKWLKGTLLLLAVGFLDFLGIYVALRAPDTPIVWIPVVFCVLFTALCVPGIVKIMRK